MDSPKADRQLLSDTDIGIALALTEGHGPANARLIDGVRTRARNYEEDAYTALANFIRTDEGSRIWEEARSERLRLSEQARF